MSDGIEVRLVSWVALRKQRHAEREWMRVQCGTIEFLLHSDGRSARVDGGDPGDEDDGRRE